ncbi:MAG: hypothetical protein H7Y42_13180 [Chitinophagaceae bacterium]|nr:hypothetical protein [Chitinophagaceae bacterium]
MKVNMYYLIVGVLSILFCFTHAWNGHTTVLPLVDAANLGLITKTTIFYIWHIISVENLIFGIAFFIMAFYKDSTKVKFAAWMITVIILARWLIIFSSTLLKDINGIKNTLIDSVAIIIFVGLIILGIRKKDKISS